MARSPWEFFRSLSLLLLLVSSGLCDLTRVRLTLSPGAVPIITRSTNKQTGWATNGEPTWYGTFPLASLKAESNIFAVASKNVGAVHVMRLARTLYENLAAEYKVAGRGIQLIHATASKKGPGSCVIAVMWDPTQEMFFASTVPKGPRKLSIIDEARRTPSKAPAWYAQIASLMTPAERGEPRKVILHAEDGVFFAWESQAQASRIVGGRYPQDKDQVKGRMTIGAYGSKLKDNGLEVEDNYPMMYNLCDEGTETSRVPGCQMVADKLGVSAVPWNTPRDVTLVTQDVGFMNITALSTKAE